MKLKSIKSKKSKKNLLPLLCMLAVAPFSASLAKDLAKESKLSAEIGLNYSVGKHEIKENSTKNSAKYSSLKALSPSIRLAYQINPKLSIIGAYESTTALSAKLKGRTHIQSVSLSTSGATPELGLELVQQLATYLLGLPDVTLFTLPSGVTFGPNEIAQTVIGWYTNNSDKINEAINEVGAIGNVNISLDTFNTSKKVKSGGNSFQLGVSYHMIEPKQNEFSLFGGFKYADFEVTPSNTTFTINISSSVGIGGNLISSSVDSAFVSKIKMFGIFGGGEYVRNHTSKVNSFANISVFIPFKIDSKQTNWSTLGSSIPQNWTSSKGFAYGVDLKAGAGYKINESFKTNLYVFYSMLNAHNLKSSEDTNKFDVVSQKIGIGASVAIK